LTITVTHTGRSIVDSRPQRRRMKNGGAPTAHRVPQGHTPDTGTGKLPPNLARPMRSCRPAVGRFPTASLFFVVRLPAGTPALLLRRVVRFRRRRQPVENPRRCPAGRIPYAEDCLRPRPGQGVDDIHRSRCCDCVPVASGDDGRRCRDVKRKEPVLETRSRGYRMGRSVTVRPPASAAASAAAKCCVSDPLFDLIRRA
jgi:hypothetical protein